MTRDVRLYLLGSFVLLALAGCGHGFFQFQEREPWRHEAELQCLNSGAVKEGTGIVRVKSIDGPGMCGADFPLKVAALGESPAYGYADEIRPPGAIPNSAQPSWPIVAPPPAPPRYSPAQPSYSPPPASPQDGASAAGAPMSITPPGAEPMDEADEAEPPGSYGAPQPYPDARPSRSAPGTSYPSSSPYPSSSAYPSAPPYPSSSAYPSASARPGPAPYPAAAPYPGAAPEREPVRLGPDRGSMVTGSVGPVTVKPAATLACPIVSELDRWFTAAVQPAAQRWFGQPVVEIKQISAYSCRGMNGQPGAHISEHAFGNALDVAAFTLADGRTVTVKTGWHGLPEEQGFLRDVEAAACQQFTTVLAPGSNRFHYDHIHVDLMRRASGRRICNPAAADGEQVAARAAERGGAYANHGDPGVTGSIAHARRGKPQLEDDEADWVEDEPEGRH